MIENKHQERFKFFFNKFPMVDYDITGDGNTVSVKNILKRFGFTELSKTNAANFIEWIIRDEDTPEIMADRLYGSTHYYWIILLFNGMYDRFWDWPLDYRSLTNYTIAKYGALNLEAVHHYVSLESVDPAYNLPAGTVVDEYYPYKSAVSNTQYEYETNEAKRKINVLDPDALGDVLSQVDTIMESGFTKVMNNARK